jgi:hypothetical protein
MLRSRVIFCGALAILTAAGAPLRAQSATKIELAFGYECGDRFVVKNDGAQPVLVEYAPAGSRDKSQLHLGGKQSVEIAMAQDGNLDLFVGGKLVASAPKGNRPCAVGGAPASTIEPASDTTTARAPEPPPGMSPVSDSTAQTDTAKVVRPVFVFLPQTDIVIVAPSPVIVYVHYPHPSAGPDGSVSRMNDAPPQNTKSSTGRDKPKKP